MELFDNKLKELLATEESFLDQDGELLEGTIQTAALSNDPKIIELLFSNEEVKNKFFVDINGIFVFQTNKFIDYISNKNFLDNSYTKYKNKIGLQTNGKFLKEIGDISLVRPFKDCVLEGGQTKDDVENEKEIFFNEILAQDEIDKLFEKKVLTNFKKYDKNGEHKVEGFNRDENGIIKDNLIIKGNNLLALHTLKKEFPGKIKLIDIDPPYYFSSKKAADTFVYNSNFKLSTRLTFMKNRLEIARELLAPNGTILVHINEAGYSYLKILMTEIFGGDNFVETFIWKNTDNPDSLSNKSRASVEYIIAFEKVINRSAEYIGKDTENGDGPILHTGNKIKTLKFPAGSIHFLIPDGKIKPGKPDRVEILNEFTIENGRNKEEVLLSGEFTWKQSTLDNELKNGSFILIKSDKFSVRAQRPESKSMAPEKFIDDVYLSKVIGVGTNEDANSHMKKLGINFSNPKPESVVSFFVRAITQPGDIILDFFLGSGTTAAVAHKMGRQYIGIEQMDYINTATLTRLTKVIEGEQGEISESVNRQGGGEFIYCELKKYNQEFIDKIEKAKDTKELLKIRELMKEKAYFKYNFDMQEFENSLDEFKNKTLEEQKEILVNILNKNQLCVNLSDIDDEDFAVSEEDKKLNDLFYNN